MNDFIDIIFIGDMNNQKSGDEAQTHFSHAGKVRTRSSRSDSGCVPVTQFTEAGEREGHDFILAAETGNTQALIHFIHDIDKIDQNEDVLDTAFHAALSQGHSECVKKLVEFGANLNARNDSGETGLCTAAIKGHVTCVQALLAAGARFDLEDKKDKTSLCLAASNQQLDCIIELMYLFYRHTASHFFSSELREMYSWIQSFMGDREQIESKACLCLCMASGLGQQDCLTALISTGLDVNLRLRIGSGSRPIYHAAAHGHQECLTLLINAGAEVNAGSEDAFSPLVFALQGQHMECVKALTEAGVDVNVLRPNDGPARPDFFDAVIYGGTTEYLNVMVEAGANVNLTDERGITCLFLAADHADLECIEALIKAEAKVNAKTDYGETPISCAELAEGDADRPRCVEALIRAGANIYLRNRGYNEPALHPRMREKCSGMFDEWMINDFSTPAIVTAAWKGQSQQVEHLILENVFNVNAQGEDGTTALIAASWEGHLQCLDILLGVSEIDINAKDYCDRTALHAAVSEDHIECMERILAREGGSVDVENALVPAVSKARIKCIEVLLEYLPEAKKSRSEMERVLNQARETQFEQRCMITLLRAGIFHWEWYERGGERDRNKLIRSLIRELVIHGYAPGMFYWDNKPCTPLMDAFRIGDCGLIRFILANLYLTPYDLSHFQKDTPLSKYVSDKGSAEIQSLHHQLVCVPWRLEVLSILKVFNMLRRYGCRQEEVVRRSELANYLPDKFFKLLSFCNPVRHLCEFEWDRIEGELLNLKNPAWPGEDNMVEKRCVCVSPCRTIVDNGKD